MRTCRIAGYIIYAVNRLYLLTVQQHHRVGRTDGQMQSAVLLIQFRQLDRLLRIGGKIMDRELESIVSLAATLYRVFAPYDFYVGLSPTLVLVVNPNLRIVVSSCDGKDRERRFEGRIDRGLLVQFHLHLCLEGLVAVFLYYHFMHTRLQFEAFVLLL